MRKLTFVIGLGLGYVFGTKAGRARYEQIMRQLRGVAEHPTVQETAGVVQAQASGLVSTAKERVGGKLAGTRLGDKLGASSQGAGGESPITPSTTDYSAGSNGVVR